MERRIYMDYASTTPLDPRVLKVMLPYFSEQFGNSSSIHTEGLEAKKAMDTARKSVAKILQAHSDEIIFTSGGTESNNLAIFGVIKALEKKGVPISKMHFITTVIEHSSVLECFRELEGRGAKVDYAPVGDDGIVNPNTIEKLLRPKTVLVSVGYANNEIGTVQPIVKIGKLLKDFNNRRNQESRIKNQDLPSGKKFRTFFHSDGSQAPLYLDCNVERLGVDLLTLDGHKMYGPKGIGVLYIRRGVPVSPILQGGGQERGLRSTTENLPGIVGFAKALEIAVAMREKESSRLAKLRDYFYSNVLENIRIRGKVIVNGSLTERLPNNINISIPDEDTEMLVLKLDVARFACSTKSSCLRDEPGSYVVRALGGGEARANSTLRITMGRDTKKEDIYLLLKILAKHI